MDLTVIDRVVEVIDYYKLKSVEFARSIGVSRQTLTGWKSKTREVPEKYLVKILFVYDDISADWLLFGLGQMFKTKSMPVDEVKVKVENKHLRELIKEKDKRLALLEKLVK